VGSSVREGRGNRWTVRFSVRKTVRNPRRVRIRLPNPNRNVERVRICVRNPDPNRREVRVECSKGRTERGEGSGGWSGSGTWMGSPKSARVAEDLNPTMRGVSRGRCVSRSCPRCVDLTPSFHGVSREATRESALPGGYSRCVDLTPTFYGDLARCPSPSQGRGLGSSSIKSRTYVSRSLAHEGRAIASRLAVSCGVRSAVSREAATGAVCGHRQANKAGSPGVVAAESRGITRIPAGTVGALLPAGGGGGGGPAVARS